MRPGASRGLNRRQVCRCVRHCSTLRVQKPEDARTPNRRSAASRDPNTETRTLLMKLESGPRERGTTSLVARLARFVVPPSGGLGASSPVSLRDDRAVCRPGGGAEPRTPLTRLTSYVGVMLTSAPAGATRRCGRVHPGPRRARTPRCAEVPSAVPYGCTAPRWCADRTARPSGR